MRTLLVATMVAGCGGTSPPPPVADMTLVLDLTFTSNCGRPGDTGNSLGVGSFCEKSSDCSKNSKALLCTTLGDSENFFCTFPCSRTGTPDQCGENARCACTGGGCGCFPTRCDGPQPDGGADAGADGGIDGGGADGSVDAGADGPTDAGAGGTTAG
jgi:hypothetical protein